MRRVSNNPGAGYKVTVDSCGEIVAPSLPPHGTVVIEADLKMLVCSNGVCRPVDPLLDQYGRDVNYCWCSVSPDGSRLLFVAHNNAYTSELDGTDLVDLGKLHAPVWRGNDSVVGMIDSDDGHYITSSDIFIVDARHPSDIHRLTPDDADIKMFPAVSPDGMRVAYNTIDGRIFIVNLTSGEP